MANSIYEIIKTIDKNDNQYMKSDIKFLNEFLKKCQFSSKDIIEIINESSLLNILLQVEKEIYAEKINIQFKSHGSRHIIDVLLFSFLIGNELLEKNELYLLLLSAKYHDIGRVNDGKEEHAKASSEIAFKQLDGFISKRDLAMIMTAIEFHEVSRRIKNIDSIFYEIAKKNNVIEEDRSRARIISEILKDADALDRTRFMNRQRLNHEYLFFDYSKRYIKFSAELQEKYALNDLMSYHINYNLLAYYTPQELLKIIRKNETKEKISTSNKIMS